MDRSDPEAMAAERHQDRLDDDADARSHNRWYWAIREEHGVELHHGWVSSHEDAYEALQAVAPPEEDESHWGTDGTYTSVWAALENDVEPGDQVRVNNGHGFVYVISDTQ